MSAVFTKPTQVAHSGGVWKGKLYTNSIESISKNYIDGFRHFEIDLVALGDGNIITAHDGNEPRFGIKDGRKFEQLTLQDVGQTCLSTKCNILTLNQLIEVVRKYKIYIILDVKNNHEYVYKKAFDLAQKAGVLEYIVPQAYNEKTIEFIKWLDFPNWLMTLWGIGVRTPQQKIDFCRIYRPEIIWMRSDWWSVEFQAELQACGAKHMGLHMDMTTEKCQQSLSMGLHVMNDCVFIDDITGTIDIEKTKNDIDCLYRLHLKRNADASGMNQKLDRIQSGKFNLRDIETELLNSKEYRLSQS